MSGCNNGLPNCITPLPMDASGKMSDYEFLCWIQNTINNLINKLPNPNMIENLEKMYSSLLVATFHGVDNTGNSDAGMQLNTLISENKGCTIYVPAGDYNIQTTVIIPVNAVFLVCDSNARFYTSTGIDTLMKLGSGVSEGNLLKYGIVGGNFDLIGVTNNGILVDNVNYSAVISNVFLRNCLCTGIRVGTNINTSTQCYINDVVILGYTDNAQGIGIRLSGTDNYLCNINIGNCKVGILMDGGGNLVTNCHVWNDYSSYPEIKNLTTLSGYNHFICNSSNRFENIQCDGPYQAFYLTNNNIYTGISNLCVNFGASGSYPIYLEDVYACTIWYQTPTTQSGSTFNVVNVDCNIREGMYYQNVRWSGSVFSNARANVNNCQYLLANVPGRTPYYQLNDYTFNVINKKAFPILSGNIQNIDTSLYYLLGYLSYEEGRCYLIISSKIGTASMQISINSSMALSVTRTNFISFNDNIDIIFGNTSITKDNEPLLPIYIKFNQNTSNLNAFFCDVIGNTFSAIYFAGYNLLTYGSVSDKPSGVTISLYQ